MNKLNESVLVTGAGGYIGSVLVPKLLAKGYSVKAVDRFYFGREKLPLHKNLTIIAEDSRKLEEEIFTNIDFVIDLVAMSNDSTGDLFPEATWQINHMSRVRTAKIAKKMGVKRYILPSTCSVYGFQNDMVSEDSTPNPLTIYAKANERAENEILPLADHQFTVVVMRQATIFGYGKRMRLDLAINSMVYTAYTSKILPLGGNGKQYRPLLHVQDTTDAMCVLLKTPSEQINGEIFNIGSAENNYQLCTLAEVVAEIVGKKLGSKIPIEWYGDVDHRSYFINCDKVEKKTEWRPQWSIARGVEELLSKLISGEIRKTSQGITSEWYMELIKWHKIIKDIEKYGGILDIKS